MVCGPAREPTGEIVRVLCNNNNKYKYNNKIAFNSIMTMHQRV
jgi:hypothetical protein